MPEAKSPVKSKTNWGLFTMLLAATIEHQEAARAFVGEHIEEPTAVAGIAFFFGLVLAAYGRWVAKTPLKVGAK